MPPDLIDEVARAYHSVASPIKWGQLNAGQKEKRRLGARHAVALVCRHFKHNLKRKDEADEIWRAIGGDA